MREVYCIEPDGKAVWAYQLSNEHGDGPTDVPVLRLSPDGSLVYAYAPRTNGSLTALDAASGAVRWTYRNSDYPLVTGAAVAGDGTVFLALATLDGAQRADEASAEERLRQADAAIMTALGPDGKVLCGDTVDRSLDFDSGWMGGSIQFYQGMVLAAGWCKLYAFTPQGEQVWAMVLKDSTQGTTCDGTALRAVSASGKVFVISRKLFALAPEGP